MVVLFGFMIFFFFLILIYKIIVNIERNTEDIRTDKVKNIIIENNIKISKRYDALLGFTLINDMENKCIWCIYNASNSIKKMSHNKIMQVELTEDEESLSVTSRGSQLGGAIVGGVLAGGVGAVIGGLSGKQTQKRTVKNVKLVITLDDLNNPFFTIEFARFTKPVETSDGEYILVHQNAFTWFKLIEVIMKRTEQGEINSKAELSEIN